MEERPILAWDPGPPYRSHQVHPRVFSAAECRAIQEIGDALVPACATLQEGHDQREDLALRQASVAWIPPEEETWWIFERLAGVVAAANQTYRFDLVGFTEDIQYTCYEEPGAFYTWHQDGLDGEVAGRKLSIVVQLSDPRTYEGADLELLDVTEDYPCEDLETWRAGARRRGSAVIFPAFEYHRVTALRSGVRRSLVCWVGGPPFR